MIEVGEASTPVDYCDNSPQTGDENNYYQDGIEPGVEEC